MEIWNAPAGYQVDLGELRPLGGPVSPAGLDAVSQVIDVVVGHLTPADSAKPTASRTYLESLAWHSQPPSGETLRLSLTVADRAGATTVLRLHGVNAAGEVLMAADLRCRRLPASPAAVEVGDMLSVPVGPGDRVNRAFVVATHMLTHHIPDAPGVLMTPNLIALIEDTAADIVRPRLAPGAAAVGTWIGVRHTGAALLGDQVDVDAVVVRTNGHRITFDVNAYVGIRRIGEGQVDFTLVAPAATPQRV